jgi:Peptidase_C39 like family
MLLAALGLLVSTFLVSGIPADEQLVLSIPYRSQMNGSRYAAANCGPTSLAMVLAYYDIDASLWDVRVRAMQAQGSWIDSEGGYSDGYGVYVHYLANAAESYGLRIEGLWNKEGGRVDSLHQWQAADLRRVLRKGHPVIVETGYRYLPGRGSSHTTLDHYIVVHGVAADQFVYSDPMDRQGGGPDRVISEPDLLNAMAHARQPQAGFALYRPGELRHPTPDT